MNEETNSMVINDATDLIDARVCAVRRALERGALDEGRWNSYRQLQSENRFVQRKAENMRRVAATRATRHSFQAAITRRKEWMYE